MARLCGLGALAVNLAAGPERETTCNDWQARRASAPGSRSPAPTLAIFRSRIPRLFRILLDIAPALCLRRRPLVQEPFMPEVIFTGPAGRLEGRYQPSKTKSAPIAMVLHPHPKFGGTMNNQVVYDLFYMFVERGFTTLRFNFRGVGRSQGEFDHGLGELSDAASALDWVQGLHPDAKGCWVAGFSFGAWIGMQLLMRRPEIEGFISVAPQPNVYDFSFLAPCPSSGLIIHGDADKVAPPSDVQGLVDKLKSQKGIKITQKVIPGANHFFVDEVGELIGECGIYLDKRLGRIEGGMSETKLLR
jgi:hypothetical protein